MIPLSRGYFFADGEGDGTAMVGKRRLKADEDIGGRRNLKIAFGMNAGVRAGVVSGRPLQMNFFLI